MPAHDDLRYQVLLLAHSAGHEGGQKTLHCLRTDFYILGNHALIQDFVWTCSTCQQKKTESLQPAMLPQPLYVLSQV
jgi:hypothetical protein